MYLKGYELQKHSLSQNGVWLHVFNTSISDVPLESISEQKRARKFWCCVGSPPTCLLNLSKFLCRLDISVTMTVAVNCLQNT